jgi:hypothetical protein
VAVFLDTSALAKLYHREIGTEVVERIVEQSAGDCFVSRLGVLEMRSVLAHRGPAPFQPLSPRWFAANFERISEGADSGLWHWGFATMMWRRCCSGPMVPFTACVRSIHSSWRALLIYTEAA